MTNETQEYKILCEKPKSGKKKKNHGLKNSSCKKIY